MSRSVLLISSHVVRPEVGLPVAAFALARLGISPWSLPSVVLSNHKAHQTVSGRAMSGNDMLDLFAALQSQGWPSQFDAVATGYLPDPEQVEAAAHIVSAIKEAREDAIFCCDPVLGDDPDGLYVLEAAAAAIRDRLLPVADLTTPNRFELAWLSERPVTDLATAISAARALPCARVLATSVPGKEDRLQNLVTDAGRVWRSEVRQRRDAPKGTGDLFTALMLGGLLLTDSAVRALALATAGVEAALGLAREEEALPVVESQESWVAPVPWPVECVD